MLETEFEALFIVANENSLIEGAARLQPAIDAVLANRRFVSPGIAQATQGDDSDAGEEDP